MLEPKPTMTPDEVEAWMRGELEPIPHVWRGDDRRHRRARYDRYLEASHAKKQERRALWADVLSHGGGG